MTRDSFATTEEKDTCLCISRTRGLDGKSYCYNDGVIDMFNCLGAPIVMSFPHLMWTKKEYQDSVEGLKTAEAEADSDKYTTEVHFQPETGLPLHVGLNVQMNMVLRPIVINNKVIASTEKLQPAIFPMIWVQENAELSDDLLEELQDQLLTNLILMDIAKWGIIGIGLLVIFISSGCLIYNKSRKSVPHTSLTKPNL